MKFYKGLVFLLSGLFKFLFRLNITGADNVPDSGNYLVVSNHISIADVFTLAISCKRQIHFMAKKELFKIPVLSQLVTALGAFPVDRKGNPASALKKAVKILEQGEIVGLFPQGTRQQNISVADTEFKSGAAFCAYKSKSGIIPAFIKTDGQKFALFRKSEIIYGKPIEFNALPLSEGGNDEYAVVSELIKREILLLEEKAYGGKYNAK